MEKLFNHYIKNNDYVNALRIAEGQCLEFPFKVTYFESAAKLAQHQNDDTRALFYLIKIWNNFVQSNEIAQQLVITTLSSDQPQLTIPYLNYLIANTHPNKHLVDQKNEINRIIQLEYKLKSMPGDLSTVNEIAASYIHSINYKAAQKYINLSLRLDPKNLKAKSLKNSVRADQIAKRDEI